MLLLSITISSIYYCYIISSACKVKKRGAVHVCILIPVTMDKGRKKFHNSHMPKHSNKSHRARETSWRMGYVLVTHNCSTECAMLSTTRYTMTERYVSIKSLRTNNIWSRTQFQFRNIGCMRRSFNICNDFIQKFS